MKSLTALRVQYDTAIARVCAQGCTRDEAAAAPTVVRVQRALFRTFAETLRLPQD